EPGSGKRSLDVRAGGAAGTGPEPRRSARNTAVAICEFGGRHLRSVAGRRAGWALSISPGHPTVRHWRSAMDLERTVLLGVGVSYAFTTRAGDRAAVIIQLNRQRRIAIYDPDDRERVLYALTLDAEESRAVAELLDLPLVMDELTDLPPALDGVRAVRIPIPAGSPYDGRKLGDTRARARTGASIRRRHGHPQGRTTGVRQGL